MGLFPIPENGLKGRIFMTAGQRPADSGNQNIFLKIRILYIIYPDFQAARERISSLPQAALRLHAVMKIQPFGLPRFEIILNEDF
ncbi:MAG: hypothetical protein LBL94_09990 [Prevotellaceae bacterium]|jgi:hypothetical protein|nr:hypothetical protein [Prevotellaceae bacterium]